jgi:hypothetical protein
MPHARRGLFKTLCPQRGRELRCGLSLASRELRMLVQIDSAGNVCNTNNFPFGGPGR